MKLGSYVALTLLAGAVAVGGTAVSAEIAGTPLTIASADGMTETDHDRDDHESSEGDAGVSAAAVRDTLKAHGYTDVRDIDRDDGRYEADARTADGNRVEVDVDAGTGRIIREEREE
ncbi:Peptidase propeptide and YPEB domain-containing protein [Limimonas halophila]|uniref:Peptidase propeptide and YPEB domain-containing protein n=1 Tax=Limimonas halophila TaxID=1082479 RepID=A0A1G7QKI2_9PROT|nr:PepSY domain-containing protein [Limimonas halophila]SDF99061.1 Peptidase propeptide and YPEB domain-containing protein [Limimonas halophila]